MKSIFKSADLSGGEAVSDCPICKHENRIKMRQAGLICESPCEHLAHYDIAGYLQVLAVYQESEVNSESGKS